MTNNKLFLFLITLFLSQSIFTQEIDEKLEKKKVLAPAKAAFFSAVLPGLGQAYNKKYWKIPIVYAGLITSAYYIKKSNDSYQVYKNAYLSRVDENNSNNSYTQYSNSDLRTLIDFYRRNREISILCFFGTYILNIIDASVSAHLFDYDISDDLSFHIQPIYFSQENTPGLSLCFNL